MQTNWDLKREIHQRGLRQGYLAAAVGIPEARMSRIVHGRSQPTPDEQRAITGFLGRDVFAAPGHSSEGDRHVASK